eukprot:TRINITY_DN19397_c0_g1_i1.p1 TRINITY_DN19397_c0_g1~~TRINITY_DN19397_c0_g1_i1.p1  ORF type:complete len:354 (-),score=87.48 TRINITY_DN19397_c0_g1_i1:143-1204(-)
MLSHDALRLVCCFAGLQLSYLTWGYLQEKIMTKQYPGGVYFPSAMFCVLSNRVLAIVVGLVAVICTQGKLTISSLSGLVAFSPPALSNTFSSFSQYQALRFVPFPLQTIAKSTKLIPVMLMGKILSSKTYSVAEYVEAIAISFGVLIFASERQSDSWELGDLSRETAIGVLLLATYITADSFTSQYQSKLFTRNPGLSQFEMMLLTNLWAGTISLVSLLYSGELWLALAFLKQYPEALVDNVIIGITSAVGQCFIFYTIKTFGPVSFTLIMTTRQMFSIMLSMVMFGHALKHTALTGSLLVFCTLFKRTHRNWEKKKIDTAKLMVDQGAPSPRLAHNRLNCRLLYTSPSPRDS